jgi:CheY-like chemotaxis protein
MARIIVIDDEPGVRSVACQALEAAGHAVVGYPDGRGGIAHIQRDPPDLLVTDLFMPEMEGLETIRLARDLQSGMPIIAMSGVYFEGGDYLEIAEKFGALATLRKPFRPGDLVDLVARLLAESQEGER